MIKAVLLNRLTDGKIYCQAGEGFSNESIQELKQKIKKYHKEVTAYSKDSNSSLKLIENTQYKIYYKVDSYVIFTVIVQNGYPIKLVNSFIDTVKNAFFDEAKCMLGVDNLTSRLESIEADHYFVKFDRVIKQKKKDYDDPSSLKNTERLKKELEFIQDVMKENMEFLDKRHNDLLATEEKAQKLKQESKNFHAGTKKLVWHLWVRKNMIWIAIALFLLVIYFVLF